MQVRGLVVIGVAADVRMARSGTGRSSRGARRRSIFPCSRRRASAHTAYRVVRLAARPRNDAAAPAIADASLVRAPGAWKPRPLLPLDAFGLAGRYDRRSWPVSTAHASRTSPAAPRAEDGRVVESWTLISPYPDAALRRLSERHAAHRSAPAVNVR